MLHVKPRARGMSSRSSTIEHAFEMVSGEPHPSLQSHFSCSEQTQIERPTSQRAPTKLAHPPANDGSVGGHARPPSERRGPHAQRGGPPPGAAMHRQSTSRYVHSGPRPTQTSPAFGIPFGQADSGSPASMSTVGAEASAFDEEDVPVLASPTARVPPSEVADADGDASAVATPLGPSAMAPQAAARRRAPRPNDRRA